MMRIPPTSVLIPAAAVTALLSAGAGLTQDVSPAAAVRPALDGNRAPYEVAFTPNGTRAIVSEFDEGAVAIIDTASGKVLSHVASGGEQPTGVAVSPDGKLALVTNSFSGSLAFVDLAALKATTLALPGTPYDVVFSPDGSVAYVSVSQFDEVAVVDVAGRKVIARMPSGRRPRALSLTPDGRVLVSANMTQGSVTFFDTANRQPFAQGPTPAVNLRGVQVYPNGRLVYAVGQRAQNERPTESAVGIWSNQAFHQVPNGQQNGVENIWLDLIGKDVSDPDSVVFDPQGKRAFVTCSGGHSVNVLPLRGGGDPQFVLGVGAVPKGLAFRPSSNEVWVANHMGNDLAVVDATSLQVTRRVNLGPTKRQDPHLQGRFLFNTATLTKGGQFSCASCHPDGNTDGISWKFIHVPDALGREINRNVRGLRGHIEDTAPFRWSGRDKTLDDFVQEELVGLFESPKLDEPRLRAMVEFVKSLPLPPNPYRKPDGTHTESALRGQALFAGKAECVSCHTGPKAGAQRKAWIGLTPQGMDLDVPHLRGVYDTYPYLHDGRARTLEEIFDKHNTQKLHGKAHELTPDELKDVLEYVREL
jgi:DNA-binding beta-propeller fold protein YncE/mono/diheme cytochrome c family protein